MLYLKKKYILLLKFSLSLFFAISSYAFAEKWDMPTPYPTKPHTVNIKKFADEVRDATNGALILRFIPLDRYKTWRN